MRNLNNRKQLIVCFKYLSSNAALCSVFCPEILSLRFYCFLNSLEKLDHWGDRAQGKEFIFSVSLPIQDSQNTFVCASEQTPQTTGGSGKEVGGWGGAHAHWQPSPEQSAAFFPMQNANSIICFPLNILGRSCRKWGFDASTNVKGIVLWSKPGFY